ncbi:valine--tRNA ligase [Candidatus Woesebacteria bacterium]|nr:valine--tRNA ligase [Candidatus Woesebacteria bacterium]
MDTRYDHQQHEQKMYDLWEKSGSFNPDTNGKKRPGSKPFTVIMPPPNANDPLHIGHAMFISIEDMFVRYHRMLGDDTLWLPGTDHAGIETQYVFEKKLQKLGKSRFQFDRETLYQMIWDYVQENSDVAIDQMKKLGASADWSRFTFTLDPQVVSSVRESFYRLHEDGLIYRDLKLVNYCTKCGTSYSELEVVHVEKTDPLYFIKYGNDLEVATVRPETMFGDVALAVHPKDARYAKYIGQTITVQLPDDALPPLQLKVYADEFVDPEFGTGVVKITPAHDPNDFAVGKKYDLPIKQVVDTRGKMMGNTGVFAGQNITDARKAVVEALINNGMLNLEKTKNDYVHSVGSCYRCGKIIEPLPLPQFFLRVKDEKKNLVTAVVNALDTKETTIHGVGREQILRNWLGQLNDWNLSRQIVWGIRIPIWYQVEGSESKITISFTDGEQIYQTGLLSDLLKTHSIDEISAGLQSLSAGSDVTYVLGEEKPQEAGLWLPETDTFDTWFSSGQWPVLTLKKNGDDDFSRFYPTNIMETAYDILLFWVMRMMMLGIYLTKKSPFSDVYLHGLIRDQKGMKMSKSKGNVVNPLTVVDSYGADALRLALIIRSTPGLDKSVGEPDFKAARNFTNKIWNAARFVLLQGDESAVLPTPDEETISTNDVTSRERIGAIVSETTKLMNDLKPGLAVDRLFDEFWHWYCDEQIELYKKGALSLAALQHNLVIFIKLLHPCLPFLTEVLWQELLEKKLVNEKMLITALWPTQQ